jgi:protein-L-isoaspartate(D-aspartate) O-methyltransferase
VLEIGTGSGYQAAVLARLCRRVITVEREPALAERAAHVLTQLGYANVEVAVADGNRGWPPAAPYPAILVAAAARTPPPALLDQLGDGGRMVIPIGADDAEYQELRLLRRHGAEVSSQLLFPVRFVPLL